MNIHQIAERLNERASKESFKIDELSELRKKYLGKKKLPSKIFTKQTIFDEYAFHHGGRDEMQFNFGEEYIDKKQCTRFALCFSLEASKSLVDPVKDLEPFRKRFNLFIKSHPDLFKDFKMWYYQEEGRSKNFASQLIPDKWFQYGNFISVGNIIMKPLAELNEEDLTIILLGFDKLLPIYQYCVLQISNDSSIEKRIARLAFSTNGWIMPSGSYGKSLSPDSYEAQFGFGHEEWLFDVSKLINGYHYGFLEPIRKQFQAYTGNNYNVWLYTFDSKSKKRYWVGEIKQIEVLTKAEADFALKKYMELGWYSEMENQIDAAGGNIKAFANWHEVDLFNIRFDPKYLKVNDPYIEIPVSHPVNNQPRYNFTHFHEEYKIEIDNEFAFIPGSNNESEDGIEVKSKNQIRELKSIEITYLHNAISKKLTALLRKEFGSNKVSSENPSGIGGNRIDIVVKSKIEGLIFYEIKTYNSLKTSIREAIGQLMEYSLWPNRKNANQLVVITQKHENIENAKIYFQHLRDTYNIPIYYQWFDFETNQLSEKF